MTHYLEKSPLAKSKQILSHKLQQEKKGKTESTTYKTLFDMCQYALILAFF